MELLNHSHHSHTAAAEGLYGNPVKLWIFWIKDTPQFAFNGKKSTQSPWMGAVLDLKQGGAASGTGQWTRLCEHPGVSGMTSGKTT